MDMNKKFMPMVMIVVLGIISLVLINSALGETAYVESLDLQGEHENTSFENVTYDETLEALKIESGETEGMWVSAEYDFDSQPATVENVTAQIDSLETDQEVLVKVWLFDEEDAVVDEIDIFFDEEGESYYEFVDPVEKESSEYFRFGIMLER